jgi:starch synthase
MFPLVKTGGLADVTGALPLALAAEGVAVTTLLPGYPAVLRALEGAEIVGAAPDCFGGAARLLRGRAAGLDVLALEAPHLYGRPGNPYTGPDGADWPDNARRFAALGFFAARIAQEGAGDFRPKILHAHDWQAGLAMAYLDDARPQPGTVMTVHNLAFQGLFNAGMLDDLRLPRGKFTPGGFEFHGMIGFLKAGLALADRITTVSPSYASEIQTPESGMNLDGLLRYRAGELTGILNGIDTQVWDPTADPYIAQCFGPGDIGPRAVNKRALQVRFGLAPDPARLLFGVISRLSWQKGLDLLLDALDDVLALGAQLVVLGSGEREMEQRFTAAAAAHPGQIGAVIGYDEALAHQIQAGIDAILIPSRFEPCGLTQLCALRYGALPIVTRTGGLADTIIDANEAALAAGTGTGLQFSQGQLRPALHRAAALWTQPNRWQRLQQNAMRTDVSWQLPARQYASLYQSLDEKKRLLS